MKGYLAALGFVSCVAVASDFGNRSAEEFIALFRKTFESLEAQGQENLTEITKSLQDYKALCDELHVDQRYDYNLTYPPALPNDPNSSGSPCGDRPSFNRALYAISVLTEELTGIKEIDQSSNEKIAAAGRRFKQAIKKDARLTLLSMALAADLGYFVQDQLLQH